MTETKYHFISLCLVRTHQGATHWVKAPAYKVNVGDLVSFKPGYSPNPSIGTVEDYVTEDENGDTYRLIARSNTIHEAQRIFSPTWDKEKPKMSPCDVCPKKRTCHTLKDCTAWKAWFLAEWDKFNNYARAHGLEIEELKQDGNES